MWRFFYPSGFAVRWEGLQPLTRFFILPWFKSQVIPSTLYKFLIIYTDLNYAAVAYYDAASLSAISHMGIGPGKGVFTTVKQPLIRLVSTDLSPVVNGGAVSCRDRIMKRYLCIAFIVASVLVVKSDEPNVFVAFTMIAQDK
ncbi:hypothetical protein L799_21310 [Enterobacter roggenkampii EC_38VIM1]|nr:hypothetical protein L799_21310 [Enterobacter roggenkampii EC_38VIM1]KTK05450.1 hypothetical protein ASU70_18880 [Enterobacter roggenkampii]